MKSIVRYSWHYCCSSLSFHRLVFWVTITKNIARKHIASLYFRLWHWYRWKNTSEIKHWWHFIAVLELVWIQSTSLRNVFEIYLHWPQTNSLNKLQTAAQWNITELEHSLMPELPESLTPIPCSLSSPLSASTAGLTPFSLAPATQHSNICVFFLLSG